MRLSLFKCSLQTNVLRKTGNIFPQLNLNHCWFGEEAYIPPPPNTHTAAAAALCIMLAAGWENTLECLLEQIEKWRRVN
jgi:hypothetical protein